MSFSAGETVGSYRVIEQLGQGGMATVYKAYHPFLERYVALKVLHPAFKEDPNFLGRFQREAKVVAQLEHPNIVPIYDFAEHEGQPYLVMKYIEGETLKARLARGPLSREELGAVLVAVGEALAYAHKQGILHRDVKPSNVLLAKDGQIFLTDFGLARIATAGESTLSSDMMVGTPQYISPEQALGKRELDEGTDIYSFGVVLYELLVGKVPFSADTPFAIIHDHIYTPLPLPRQVNPALSEAEEGALLKALAKNRADRFASVPEMVRAFQSALFPGVSEVPAPPASTIQPLTQDVSKTIIKDVAVEPQGVNAQSSALTEKMASPIGPPEPGAPVNEVAPGLPGSEQSTGKNRNTGLIAGGIAFIILCACILVFAGLLRNGRLGLRKTSAQSTQTATSGQAALLPTSTLGIGQTPTGVQNSTGAALQTAIQKVSQNPNDPAAHLELASAYVMTRQAAQAKKELQTTQSLVDNAAFYTTAGDGYFEVKIWVVAAWSYLRAYKFGSGLSAQEIEHLHEAVYLAYKNPDAEDIIPPETISAADQLLAGASQARFEVYNGTIASAQLFLDNVFKVQNDYPEARLAQAELFIANKQFVRARTVLDTINKNPGVPVWIKDQAGLFLSYLNP